MLIIGLGSNSGDRLAHLPNALGLIKSLAEVEIKQLSPVYLSDALLLEQAPAEWDLPFLNVALRCETTLEPFALLKKLQTIEKKLGRQSTSPPWSPRIIDIDLLAWGDTIINHEALTIPHAHLLNRPFALWPLADVAPFWCLPGQSKTAAQLVEKWGSRFTGHAPLHTKQIYQRIDTPQLVGIVNITPDSFSDGGKFLDAEKAWSTGFRSRSCWSRGD